MRFPELPPSSAAAVRDAGTYVTGLMTPTLRLGVTGLSRAGKTVFITALIRNLVSGGRLPFFTPHAQGRIQRAYLEPQPDDAVPRFDYEAHVACLSADPPSWPESTRRISELRITIEYVSQSRLWRTLGPGKLHLDIVDYPGEWLIDLALMDQSFEAWSAEALAHAGERREQAAAFLAFVAALPDDDAEQIAIRGGALFAQYLAAARASEAGLATLGPGRFLTPGDLEGSPLVTFFPLPATAAGEPDARSALAKLLRQRFNSYKDKVVKPFFRDHFSRLDRQIVLVDALGAVNRGAAAVGDLERALAAVLKAFRPGTQTWLDRLVDRRRIDRLVFAATKADHLPSSSHDRLEAILAALTGRAAERATGAGAEVHVMALAALRSTREAEAKSPDGGAPLPLIVGVPLAGEMIGKTRFDGLTETAIFPGDLPADPQSVFATVAGTASDNSTSSRIGDEDPGLRFLRFRPPRLAPPGKGGDVPPAPHIRLDRALDVLLSDYLS